jgi:hypothetical protein
MSFDASKVSDVIKGIDELDQRADLLDDMRAGSAPLSAALDSVSVQEVSTKLDAVRGIAASSFGTGLSSAGLSGATTSLDMVRASMKPLGAGLAGGFTENTMHDMAKRLAKMAMPADAVTVLKDMQRRPAIDAAKFLTYGDLNRRVIDTASTLSGLGRIGTIENFRSVRDFKPLEIPSVLSYAMGFDKSLTAFDAAINNSVAEIGKKVFERFYGWMERFRPFMDHWAQIAEDIRRYAERASQPTHPEGDLIAFAALEALEALQAGRHWVAVAFLQKRLNLRATVERLEALWMLLTRAFEGPFDSPPLWLTLKPDKARAYLATAVYRVAERIRRRREMEDNVWGTTNGKELVRPGSTRLVYIEDQPADNFGSPELNPAQLIDLMMDDRNVILDNLMATGTPADREIIGLIRSGHYDRADIRNQVGSARLQAFERKVQRHRRNNGKILPGDG